MANEGKKFEDCFRKSVPDYCLLQRLNDSAQAFQKSGFAKFTPKNPCDFFMFDTKSRTLFCLEMKSTKYKSMAFEDIFSNEEQNKMIHKHQILALMKFAEYSYVVSGFILNFRDETNNMERTYFQNINNFRTMCDAIGKTSFNELDLIRYGAVKIVGTKKRVNYTWDVDKLIGQLTTGGK